MLRFSSITSVPVMSAGIRSGVNWMRLKLRFSARLSVLIISVLASPGTPSSRQCPRLNKRNQQFFDHVVLADDDLGQLGDDLFRAAPAFRSPRCRVLNCCRSSGVSSMAVFLINCHLTVGMC